MTFIVAIWTLVISKIASDSGRNTEGDPGCLMLCAVLSDVLCVVAVVALVMWLW